MKENLVIIPCYNENTNLISVVNDIENNTKNFDYVIVNDCSTDNTLEVLKDHNYNYIDLPANLGIGGAVQTGYIYAYLKGYKTAVQIDGDGQHDAGFLENMLNILNSENLDMVIGSRFIEGQGFQSSSLRRFGINYFKNLIKLLTGQTITDPTSGLRLSNRKIIEEFAKNYPTDYPEPESVVSILCKKAKVKEIPVIMKERAGGKSSITLFKGAYYMIKVSIAIVLARLNK